MSIPPLPFLWTFSCAGVTVSAADLGVTGLTRHRASQATDTCRLRFDGRACDAAPPFDPGATVTVARAGVAWFTGRVTAYPVEGNADGEAQVCELSGPWWHLAQLVCQQPWTVQGGAATAWTSRLVLGQAADGSALTTGQVIAATLQYAIDAGAPLAIGTIDPAIATPLDEVRDVTCAEVIRAMLHWHPDCVAWFDYSTAPAPTFHCRARGNLPAATLRVGEPPLAAVRGLSARHDLAVPAVVLHYETIQQVDGQAQTAVVTDAAPAGATGREFGAVVGTIPRRGQAAVLLSQRIVTRPLATATGDPGAAASLLLELSPALASHAVGDIAVTSLARGVPAVPLTLAPAANVSLGNVLTGGQITDWMTDRCGVSTQTQRLTFSYTLGGTGCAPQQASIDVMATNAVSGLYTALSSSGPFDPAPPMGLAAAHLAAWSEVAYSGSLVLVEPEAGDGAATGAGAGLGVVVNLAGGAVADWAAMRAAVVAETVDVAAGTTTLTLGPPVEREGLAAKLQTTRPDAPGRVAGSPAALSTASSASRTTGMPG